MTYSPPQRAVLNVDGPAPEAVTPYRAYRYSPQIIPGVVKAADLTAIAAAGLIAALLRPDAQALDYSVTFVLSTMFLQIFIGDRANLFSIDAAMKPLKRADDLVISILTAMFFFLSVVFALQVAERLAFDWVALFVAAAVIGVVGLRFALFRVLCGFANRGVIGQRMAILGAGQQGRRFIRHFQETKPHMVSLAGVFYGRHVEPGVTEVEGAPVLGDVSNLFAMARARKIDDVVVAMPWNADKDLTSTVEQLKELPVNVYLSTDLIGFELAFRPAHGAVTDLPLFEVVQRPISGWASVAKTLLDYVAASMALLLVSPLLALIAIAIKLDSEGPVFFRQKRLGFNNEVFFIYKFRSMYHGRTPDHAVTQATRNDPRVTRVGRFIRATSLDELPQLLNVIDGTMSLVGPRPHPLVLNEEYGRVIRGYFERHKVKPGITGWAQINGLRGETDVMEKMEDRIRHDVYYVENWSLLFDIRILVMTVAVVLFQKTAY